MKGRFDALKYAKTLEKQLSADPARRKKLSDQLSDIEKRGRGAEENGSDLTGLNKMVADARALLEKNEYGKVDELVSTCETELRKFSSRSVENDLARAGELVGDVETMGVDVTRALELIEKADEALKANEPENARKFALEGQKEAQSARDAALNEAVSYARTLVGESEKLGMDITKFRDSLDRINGHIEKGDFAAAFSLALPIPDDVDRARRPYFRDLMARVNATVSKSRDGGADTARMEATVQKAKHALDAKDYETAAQLLKDAENLTTRDRSDQEEAETAIAAASELLDRARSVPIAVRELEKELGDARKKLEGSDAAGARNAAISVKKKLDDAIAGHSEVSKALAEARATVTEAVKMGLDNRRHEATLAGAEKMLREGRQSEALSSVRSLTTMLVQSQKELSSDALASLEGDIGEFRGAGAIVKGPEELLHQAKASLDAGKYSEAFQLARQTLDNLESLREHYSRYRQAFSNIEEMISAAESAGTDISEASGFIQEAQASAAKGDYGPASEAASRALGLLGGTREAATADEETAEALYQVRKCDEEGAALEDIEKTVIAMIISSEGGQTTKAAEAVKAVEKAATNQLRAFLMATDAVSRAQEMLAEGMMQGIGLSEENHKLENARKSCAGGDYETGRYGAEDISPSLRIRLRSEMDAALQAATQVVEQALKGGIRVARGREYLRRAKSLGEVGRFGASHGYAVLAREEAHGTEKIFRQVEDAKTLLDSMGTTAREAGVKIPELETGASGVDAFIASGEYDKALTMAAGAMEKAEGEFDRQARELCDRLSGELEAAGADRIDTNAEAKSLEKGMEHIEKGEHAEAILAVRSSFEAIAEKRGQHSKARETLETASRIIEEADKLEIPSGPLRQRVQEAQQAFSDGKFETSISVSHSAIEAAEDLMDEKSGRALLELNENRDAAEGAGTVIADLKERLDGVPAKLASKAYAAAIGEMRALSSELSTRRRKRDEAAASLEQVQSAVEDAKSIGADVSPAEDLIGMARFAMERGAYEDIIDYLKRAETELAGAGGTLLRGAEAELGKKISALEKEGVELGAVKRTLEENAALASQRQFRAAFAHLKKIETEMGVRKDQYKNTQKILTAAEKTLNGARELGVRSNDAEEYLTLARGAADAGDYPKAVELAEQCKEKAAADVEIHQQTTGALELARSHSRDAEAMGADVARSSELLGQALSHIENGAYDSAMENIVESEQDVVRSQETLVSDTAQAAKAVMDSASGIGADTTRAKELLAQSEGAAASREFEEALRLTRSAQEAAQQSSEKHSTVLGTLTEVQKLVHIAHSEGIRMDALISELEKAREALQKFDYEDCLERADRCRSEGQKRIEDASAARRSIEGCEISLRGASGIGGDTGEAGELFSQAKVAFDSGEYDAAGELSGKCRAMLTQAQHEMVWASLGECIVELETASERGADVSGPGASVEEAGAYLTAGEYSKSLGLANACREQIASSLQAYENALSPINACNMAITEARFLEADVAVAADLAAGASEALSSHMYPEAVDLAHQAAEETARSLKAALTLSLGDVDRSLTEAEDRGVRSRRARDRLVRARVCIDHIDFKGAGLLLEETVRSLTQALQSHRKTVDVLNSLTETIQRAGGIGVDVARYRDVASRLEAMAAMGDYSKALEGTDTLFKEISAAETGHLTARLGEIGKALEDAKGLGMDTAPEIAALEDAQSALTSGDVEKAFKISKKASDDLTANRREFERVGMALAGFEKDIRAAGALGVDIGEAGEALEISRENLAKGSYVAAEDTLKKGAITLNALQSEHMSLLLTDFDAQLQKSEKGGMKALRSRETVKEADRLYRNQEYSAMLTKLGQAKSEYATAVKEHSEVVSALGEMEKRFASALTLGADIGRARELTTKAGDICAEGDFENARAVLGEAGAAALSAEKSHVQAIITTTTTMLDEGDTIGADTRTPRKAIADAKKMFEQAEYYKAADLANGALEDAEKRVEEHRKHIDLAAATEKIITDAEADGLNMERSRRLLEEARRALKKYDYGASVSGMENIQRDVQTLTKQSREARRIISFCEQKINAAKKIGADIKSAQDLIEEAKAATEKRIFVRAFDLATKCLKELDRMQHSVVLGFLTDLEVQLAEIEESGADIGDSGDAVEVAIEALNENEFEKAMELARHTLEDARAKKLQHETSAETLRELELKMKDASQVGGDVSTLEDLLGDGRDLLGNHDYGGVSELVVHGLDALNTALTKLVNAKTKDASRVILEVEEVGANVARARDRIARAKRALECGDYKSALNLLEESAGAADEARRKHSKTMETLRSLQDLAEEAAELGIDTTRTKKALCDIEIAIDTGVYEEANRIILEAQDDLDKGYSKAAEDILTRTTEALTNARTLGANTGAEDKILERAKGMLAEGGYAQAIRDCREAQRKVDERINEHIAELILLAENLLSEASKIDIDTKDFKGLLERSEDAVAEGNYDQALKLANECMEKTRGALHNSVKGTLASLRGLVEETQKIGVDVKEVEDYVKIALTALEQDEFETAHEQTLAGIAAVDRLREEYLKKRLSVVDLRLRDAEDMGAAVDDLKKFIDKARELVEAAEFEKASGILKDTEENISKRQARLVEEAVKRSEEMLGKVKMDIDLSKPRSLLEEARGALRKGVYDEALDYSNQSVEEANRVQHQFVGEVISATEELIISARELGADVKKATSLLEGAKADQGSNSYDSSLDRAVASSEEVERAQHDFVRTPIEYCRTILKTANITDERITKVLQTAEDLLEEKEFADAHTEVLRALELTEDIQEKLTLKEISDAEEILVAMEKSGARSATARDLLTGALKSLDAKEFARALKSAKDCAADAQKTLDDYENASRVLKEAREEVTALTGSDLASEELVDLLELAEHEFTGGDYAKVTDFASQSLALAKSAYVKSAAEALSSSQFKINYAKNIGADVSAAEDIIKQAKAAHEEKDYRKAVELARRCREEAEKAKERYKELVDTIYSAESKISVAHTYGLDTTAAEKLLSQAVTLKSKNGEEALDFARQSMEEVQRGLEKYSPEVKGDIKLAGQIQKEKWSEAVLAIVNSGKATAKDISIRFSGDIDIQGAEKLPVLRAGETRKQNIKVRPNKGGDLPLSINITCLREFDGKEFKFPETRWIRVEDVTPLATPLNQFVTKSVRCHICLGTIKSGLPLIKCQCGKTYHETCASRVGECPNCGRDLRNTAKGDT